MIVIKDGNGPGIIAMDKEGLLMGVLSGNFICRGGDFYHILVMCGLRDFLIEQGFLRVERGERKVNDYYTHRWAHFHVERDFRVTFGDQGHYDYKVGMTADPQFQDIIKPGGELYSDKN